LEKFFSRRFALQEGLHSSGNLVGALCEAHQGGLGVRSGNSCQNIEQLPGVLGLNAIQFCQERRNKDVSIMNLIQLLHHTVTLEALDRLEALEQLGDG
jgi:hypothetical protein